MWIRMSGDYAYPLIYQDEVAFGLSRVRRVVGVHPTTRLCTPERVIVDGDEATIGRMKVL